MRPKEFLQLLLNHHFLEEQELIKMMIMESKQQVKSKVVQVIDPDQLDYQTILEEVLLRFLKRFLILFKKISILTVILFRILKVLFLPIKTRRNSTKDKQILESKDKFDNQK